MALNGEQGPLLAEVLLSVASVLLGWFTIHTMAAMHYAYEYYEFALGQSRRPSQGKPWSAGWISPKATIRTAWRSSISPM